jgi:tetratricopeptide (TPR) repeat protein
MMKFQFFFKVLAASLIFLAACERTKKSADYIPTSIIICKTTASDKSWYSAKQKAMLFDGLGNIHFSITTTKPEAQLYFDQGLMLAVGFNHAEAARSFFEATRIDTTCAMAYWGFSYVLGPNYNAGMEPDNYGRAYESVQKALKLSANCSVKESLLIRALSKRYPSAPVGNRKPYDQAYSDALKEIYRQFPDDANVAVLYAESLMDLHPWDLWEKDGRPKSWTPEIVSVLEKSLVKSPDHIGLHHLYIHAVEASNQPERALASATFLEDGAPNASHLLHMPSHIYIRTGRYHQGSLANLKAVKIDSIYLAGTYAQGAFPLVYFPHNYHFLAATATLEGDFPQAMLAATKVSEFTKKDLLDEPGWATLQHYYTIPYHVAIKFGQWDRIAAMVAKDTVRLKYPVAIRHYALGLTLVAKGQIPKAKAELRQLKYLTKDQDIAKLTIWDINSMSSILQIASLVLEGEIISKEGRLTASEQLLKEAVKLEDALNYNEPPDWFFSVRHNLGNVLLANRKYAEAQFIFMQDLKVFPMNMWAQTGLQKAQEKLSLARKEL